MPRKLIVNADDFGFTRGANTGIVEAHTRGILTATTLMAHGEAFDHAVELARATPTLDVGVHLVLWAEDAGPQPLSPFVWQALRMNGAQMEKLFAAQVEKILDHGITPSHIDTHKHLHTMPNVLSAVIATAERFAIPWMRRPFIPWREIPLRTTDHFRGLSLTGKMDTPSLLAELRALPEGLSELMCHPAHHDQDLERAATRLKEQRQRELVALTAPEIRALVETTGIQLTNYRNETSVLGSRPHP